MRFRSTRPAGVRRVRCTAALLAAFALTAAGCSGGGSADRSTVDTRAPSGSTGSTTAAGEESTLEWATCDDPAATDPAAKCATLTVPLDYDDPDGATIDLALVEAPGSADDRDGAVLFNPGGPGASGFEFIAGGGRTISSRLGFEHLDLIGFDPRGVDRSGGLRCLTDAELDQYAYPDDTPDDAAEQALLEESKTAFSTACAAKYGDSLRFYSTANTARDMDAIRRALGDSTISYLGISYGTYLGAVFATMFPDTVRAMALDSAFEPTGDTVEQQYTTQLVGFEHAFDDFATWCAGTDECAFRGNDRGADVGAGWDALYIRLDDHPITNADGRVGNQALLRRATIASLYSESDWPVLGAALEQAADGDPSGLFRLADGYFSRADDGTYATIQQSNTIINCASGIVADPAPDPTALVDELHRTAPRFSRSITVADVERDDCAALMPAQPLDEIEYSGSAPIVVVGGQNDPATPFRWATEMTAALGSSARLLTYTGEGHGQLLVSSCVTEAEAAVLVDEQTPVANTTCDPDPVIEEPTWWSSVPLPDGIDPTLHAAALDSALGITPTSVFAELHTTDLSADDTLTAYTRALVAEGFVLLGQQTPIDGTKQAVYSVPASDDLFSILVTEPEAFTTGILQPVADLVPAGTTLVVLAYAPL